MMDLFKAIGLGLVVLLPLANPLTTVALFLGLAGNMNSAERNASVTHGVRLRVCHHDGGVLCRTTGDECLRDFDSRVTYRGWVNSCVYRLSNVFPQQKAHDSPEARSKSEELEDEPTANIAFVPLAMPSTASCNRSE